MSDTHIFLRLPNIKGESTTQGYYEDIEIESISWDMGVKSKGSKASDANEKQQVELGSLTISKHFDIATTGILKRLKAQKRARAGGGSPAFMRMKIVYADVMPGRGGGTHVVPVLEYLVQDCYIETLSLNVSGGGKGVAVTEQIVIRYMKIDVTYHPPTKDRASRPSAIVFNSTAAAAKSS